SWQVAWRALRDELARLRKEFRMEIREETRAQIMALFRQVVQMLKEEGKLSELEETLKEMIAMAPADAESYKELGKIYRQRGDKVPKVFCDGNELKPDVPPVIKEGRTLIPVRAIAQALGATVQWNEKERTVLIAKGDVTIKIQVDNRVAFVNGKRVELDVPAKNISNRVFVPLRFISQALKAKVDYYPEGQIVVVNQGDAQAQE
ncbi:MAG: copper amine oxidase N-terminal domain-containing protein, partial [Thermacetogeniaceae bacterium]